MLFKPDLLVKVLIGEKTQTRRLIKPGQYAVCSLHPDDGQRIVRVQQEGRGIVYSIGRQYAVCPGRGQRRQGNFKLSSIRQEDVRQISVDDALAEGFESRLDFLTRWTSMHDRQICIVPIEEESLFSVFMIGAVAAQFGSVKGWHRMKSVDLWEVLLSRPLNLYMAWALTFEVAK